jgi:hypothetical protein
LGRLDVRGGVVGLRGRRLHHHWRLRSGCLQQSPALHPVLEGLLRQLLQLPQRLLLLRLL